MILLKIWRNLLLSLSLSLRNASILQRIKEGYLFWLDISQHIAKSRKYTIGNKIENKFLDLLELTYIAYFANKDCKSEKISQCILSLDTLKFLIYIAWEAKIISHQQYAGIAEKLNETGKMFGGWKNSLANPRKQNRAL